MSKYGCGLTINETCKLEVAEATEILNSYHVSAEDINAITMMIKEAYFQWNKTAASGRALERMFNEATGEKASSGEHFQTYMMYAMEEEAKYPFDLGEDEEE